MNMVMVYNTFIDGPLSVLQEQNLSVGVGEWAAMWPDVIFFEVTVTEV